ncbi:hypothetical protein M407DRAFT_17322 [Tulasnella calospora MUT 4182]|uniref:RNA helicase n=1 Tax=Tulasnella calospora MUT 4182 TaxID=1051891 RepID=A0A0C3QXD4_9AGAM|nr:hypothetical protein M407DRAFT_17322 [Tulasnella calospora MUT 4182]
MQGPEVEASDNVGLVTQEIYSTLPPQRGPGVKCRLCERTVARHEWSQHLSDPGHARKARLATYQQALQEGTRDKLGISIITGDLDFGVVELDSLKDWPTREDSFYVQVDEDGYWIKNIRMTSTLGSFADFRDASFQVRFSAPVRLQPKITYSLKVTFDPKGNRGIHEDRVEFTFDSPSKGIQFVIIREVKATVTVPAHHQQLSPLEEYIRPKRRPREYKSSVMDGVKPSNFERQKIAFRVWLPEFKIPSELIEIFGHGSTESQVETILNMFPEGLDHAAYSDFWQVLLWLEEHQMNKDMENYDQIDTQFSVRLRRNYLYVSLKSVSKLPLKFPLEVPGLAERRPSVIVGDSVLVRPTNSPPGKWFRGYVHGIQQTHVSLGLHPSFDYPPGQKINVEFELNRSLLRRMHWAMRSAYAPRQTLFPRPGDVFVHGLAAPSEQESLQMTIISDKRIRENPPQLQAVTAIRSQRISPQFKQEIRPGTGKTVTLVEAILQVLYRLPKAMVLVCAPSNNAADIIAGRLRMFFYPSQLFRLNAPSRAKDLPRGLETYSLRYDDGSFMVPPLLVLMQYRIVVSTCASSSLLHGVGVPYGHFTHIFVDEAGQASEPEVMIPIKLNAGPRTSVILAGDPKQLGPVIRSPVARQLGLDRSYLERLMSLPMYEVKEYRGATYVKLIKNWRSNPAIIRFPNQMFYDGELEACAPSSVANLCVGWKGLPNPGYPVVFHAIKGRDLREVSSPSWFNIEEASAVWYYVRDLRCDRALGLEDQQIGVISPYRAQVRKIRTILGINFSDVKVGTTEEFQGDERHAIIVSTVRSSLDFVEFDLRHTLGFVANPRRFNVAMTRAKSILIIIGDPDVLGLDPLWRQFLNHIHAHGGWRGIRIPWDPTKDVLTETSEAENLPYDAQIRAKSEQDLRDLVARASVTGLGVVDEEDELEADADQHWHHDE